MKKIIAIFSIILLVTIFMFAIKFSTKADDIREISVEQASLKEEPRNFSKTIHTLKLYDKVQILEQLDTWLLVVSLDTDIEGYIQESVVSTDAVGTDVSDDLATGESSTAGARGFSSEVEAEYKDKSTFDYDSVDIAEKLTDPYSKNPEANFSKFREAGKLGEYQE
jgi:hypothetical protein